MPPDVLRHCSGTQTPFAPHKQRLLVAATKAAKVPGKNKGKGKGEDPKETKKDDGKAKQKQKKAEEKKPPKKARKRQEPTAYGKAKKEFMAKPLI